MLTKEERNAIAERAEKFDFTEDGCVVICNFDNTICTDQGKELTHNSPITTVYFAEKIREILKDDDDMNTWTNSRLSDIARSRYE